MRIRRLCGPAHSHYLLMLPSEYLPASPGEVVLLYLLLPPLLLNQAFWAPAGPCQLQ